MKPNLFTIIETSATTPGFAVFKHPKDKSLTVDEDLIREIIDVVQKSVRLPAFFSQCKKTTELAIQFCTKQKTSSSIRGVWLALSGDHTQSAFHKQCGCLHQVPLIYANNVFYLFDFFNFFAKDTPSVITSILVFPFEDFRFEKILELTGSQENSWINKFSGEPFINEDLTFKALTSSAESWSAFLKKFNAVNNSRRNFSFFVNPRSLKKDEKDKEIDGSKRLCG